MKRYLLFASAIFLITISCDKNRNSEVLYNGTVVDMDNGCVLPPNQIPYVIKFDDVTELEDNHPIRVNSGMDSSCIAIIPDEYKVVGKKIRFGFRKREPDEEFTCFGNIGYYQVIITEISSNE